MDVHDDNIKIARERHWSEMKRRTTPACPKGHGPTTVCLKGKKYLPVDKELPERTKETTIDCWV